MFKKSAFSLSTHEWITLFSELSIPENSLFFWLRWLYKNKINIHEHISPLHLEALNSLLDFSLPKITKTLTASDGTVKFQVAFEDNLEVETVLIPFKKRYTVCLSTQVGCAMNCNFCYTGTQGLKRNLKVHEIIGQYLLAKNYLLQVFPNSIPPRIVFMGQGEPLHNFDELKHALLILTDKRLINLGPKEITLSTAGFLPGLLKASSLPKINYALSLHSPFNDERQMLIPISSNFHLDSVVKELDDLSLHNKSIITYEYLLIQNFNMSDHHIKGLVKLLSSRKAVLNLIPFNPFPGSTWTRPIPQEIQIFKNKLVENKIRVFIRTTKGDEILAACGQLKINKFSKGN
jgi:23S rRNA (adenine2503-C2)-methyltransferase